MYQCQFLCRDDSIRQTAWQMLAQLPMAALLAALTPADWRALFDAALVPPSQPQPRDPAAATAGLRPTLQQLRDQQGADAAADVASADAPAGATKQVLMSCSYKAGSCAWPIVACAPSVLALFHYCCSAGCDHHAAARHADTQAVREQQTHMVVNIDQKILARSKQADYGIAMVGGCMTSCGAIICSLRFLLRLT